MLHSSFGTATWLDKGALFLAYDHGMGCSTGLDIALVWRIADDITCRSQEGLRSTWIGMG
jgi:hypothetical protein